MAEIMPEIMPKLMPAVDVIGLCVVVWLAVAWAMESMIRDLRQSKWPRNWW